MSAASVVYSLVISMHPRAVPALGRLRGVAAEADVGAPAAGLKLFDAQAAQEHFVLGAVVFRVVLEDGAFEVLADVAGLGIGEFLAEREAKERQRFGVADTLVAEFEARSLPVVEEAAAKGVAGLTKIEAAFRLLDEDDGVEGLGVEQPGAFGGGVSEPSDQDFVGCAGEVGMVFEALSFEVLDAQGIARIRIAFSVFAGEREAEDGQAAASRPRSSGILSRAGASCRRRSDRFPSRRLCGFRVWLAGRLRRSLQ